MGLVMVCPQCQAKVLLQFQNCPYCQADLRNVPQDQRCYEVGKPGPYTPPAASAPAATEAIPVLTSAGVPEAVSQPSAAERVRRPYVRRYAGSPASASAPAPKPTSGKPAKAAQSKPKAKKPKAAASKKKK